MLFRKGDHFKELKPILRLGWPVILGQLCIMATGFLDTLMAGRYSATDLAAVALGSNLIWPFYLLLAGSSMALTPMGLPVAGGPSSISGRPPSMAGPMDRHSRSYLVTSDIE